MPVLSLLRQSITITRGNFMRLLGLFNVLLFVAFFALLFLGGKVMARVYAKYINLCKSRCQIKEKKNYKLRY